jgi:hypothetical protein
MGEGFEADVWMLDGPATTTSFPRRRKPLHAQAMLRPTLESLQDSKAVTSAVT